MTADFLTDATDAKSIPGEIVNDIVNVNHGMSGETCVCNIGVEKFSGTSGANSGLWTMSAKRSAAKSEIRAVCIKSGATARKNPIPEHLVIDGDSGPAGKAYIFQIFFEFFNFAQGKLKGMFDTAQPGKSGSALMNISGPVVELPGRYSKSPENHLSSAERGKPPNDANDMSFLWGKKFFWISDLSHEIAEDEIYPFEHFQLFEKAFLLDVFDQSNFSSGHGVHDKKIVRIIFISPVRARGSGDDKPESLRKDSKPFREFHFRVVSSVFSGGWNLRTEGSLSHAA